MRVFLINDTEDVYHWGCYGTSRAIKDKLLEMGVSKIECLPVGQTHLLPNIPTELTNLLTKNVFCSTYADVADKIDRCDIVVINGEGTIHGFKSGARALLFLAYASKIFFGKKVILINHSCFPNPIRKNMIDFYKSAYSVCDFVSARESLSAKIIRNKLGVKCVEAFDCLPLSIKNNYGQVPSTLIQKPYICISGAVNYKVSLSSAIARQLKRKFPNHEYIYLVGSKNEGANHEELRVFQSIKTFLPNLQWYDATCFTDWLSIIKHSELLLSGRFHYIIAGLCLGCRIISFRSNTSKIEGILKDLHLPGVIPRKPSFLFEYAFWNKLKNIEKIPKADHLDFCCDLAMKNFDWEL